MYIDFLGIFQLQECEKKIVRKKNNFVLGLNWATDQLCCEKKKICIAILVLYCDLKGLNGS